MQKTLIKAILTTGLMTITGITQAGTIIGGSDLLTSAYHSQLENWLGKGSIDLTNVFDKQSGDTGVDFHAVVDGKGPTFTLIEIFNGSDAMIIGGYNQSSWYSSRSYNLVDYVTSESFLFNLNTGIKYDRSRYSYDTYNHYSYGPTFGGGHDLYIQNNLTRGYTNIGHSYGDTSRYGTSSYRNEFAGSYNSWTVGALEVFTYEPSSHAIPEPAPMLLMGLGLLGFTLSKNRLISRKISRTEHI